MEARTKSIETSYNGYKFRSRLEARWAVFFDASHIQYEYESEGFELDDGTRYLPDFYLPDLGWYVEVKPPRDGIEDELWRASRFVGDKIRVLLLLGNIPPKAKYPVWHFHALYYNALRDQVMVARVCNEMDTTDDRLDGCFTPYVVIDYGQETSADALLVHDFAVECVTPLNDIDAYKGSGHRPWCETWPSWMKSGMESCFNTARCAMFEHGETPKARTRKKRTKA